MGGALGAARLEPRRITGEGQGGTKSFACGVEGEEGGCGAEWGAEEKRERGSALRPAPRPSRRQLADWWNSETCERAPYIQPGGGAAAGRSAPGRGLNADRPGSPGNAARRPADVRPLLGLSLVAANFFPRGRGRAGRAARASRAAWGVRPPWVLLGSGGGNI